MPNILRNVGEQPADVYCDDQHYTIGPFDRLVLSDIENTHQLISMMSTVCSPSTTGGNVYIEHKDMNVSGNTDRSFTAGTVKYNRADPSQKKGF